MTTSSPSWLPTWPTNFPDVQDGYQQTVPRQFPAGLYYEGREEYQDLLSLAQVVSWVRQGSTWVGRRLWPHLDVTGEFLGLWEDGLGVAAAFTLSARRDNILRVFRYILGTATEDAVKAIFAPLFGSADDPGSVAFASPSSAEIIAAGLTTESGWAMATNSLHIYHRDEAVEPDRASADGAIAQTKPTYQRWTAGRYKYAKWDTQGGWDTACWSA